MDYGNDAERNDSDSVKAKAVVRINLFNVIKEK